MDLKELVNQCLLGNRDAQRLLFDTFVTPMTRLCIRYLKDHDLAKDAMMDGFLKVFDRLKQFRFYHDQSLQMWIRTIMINECLMKLRRDRSRWFADVNQAESEVHDEALSAEEIMILVQSLPEGYRTVFNLHVIDGYSHKEISVILDITESASRSQLTHARAKLKELLRKHGWNE